MKHTRASMMLTFEQDVQIGELKATLHAQTYLNHADDKEFDIEFIDIDRITYHGVAIEGYDNWKKFRKFHADMGIDFDKLLDDEFKKIFTKEAIRKQIKALNLKF